LQKQLESEKSRSIQLENQLADALPSSEDSLDELSAARAKRMKRDQGGLDYYSAEEASRQEGGQEGDPDSMDLPQRGPQGSAQEVGAQEVGGQEGGGQEGGLIGSGPTGSGLLGGGLDRGRPFSFPMAEGTVNDETMAPRKQPKLLKRYGGSVPKDAAAPPAPREPMPGQSRSLDKIELKLDSLEFDGEVEPMEIDETEEFEDRMFEAPAVMIPSDQGLESSKSLSRPSSQRFGSSSRSGDDSELAGELAGGKSMDGIIIDVGAFDDGGVVGDSEESPRRNSKPRPKDRGESARLKTAGAPELSKQQAAREKGTLAPSSTTRPVPSHLKDLGLSFKTKMKLETKTRSVPVQRTRTSPIHRSSISELLCASTGCCCFTRRIQGR